MPIVTRPEAEGTAALSEVSRHPGCPVEQGDPAAAEQLLPLVYDELRKLAAQKLAQEKPGQTLQATALVHEAYLRLVGADDGRRLEQPRPLLRRRRRGDAPHPRRRRPPQGPPEARRRTPDRVDLDRACLVSRPRSDDLLALDEALDAPGRRRPGRGGPGRSCATSPG